MAIRDKIATNAQPYLEPGERIQVVFVGQTKSGWWGLLSYLVFFWNKYLDVIVTDRRILVLQCGAMQSTRPKSLLLVAPRQILIGPANGLWWKCTTLGKQMYVHKRFHKDIEAADAQIIGRQLPTV